MAASSRIMMMTWQEAVIAMAMVMLLHLRLGGGVVTADAIGTGRSLQARSCFSMDSSDVNALLDLKAAWTLDTRNVAYESWKDGGSWAYVVCNPQNRVILVQLSGLDLNLPLPSSIGKLDKLRQLSLYRLNITGDVPASFTSLTGLSYLDLSYNKLTGNIDPINALSSLETLYIQNSLLTTLPSALTKLKSLRYVSLFRNSIASLPTSFGSLSQMVYLNLKMNLLKTLPRTFSRLTNLKDLDLSFNNLTKVPAGMFNLKLLESLDLVGNKLTRAVSINNMPSLNYLDLSLNTISSMAPILRLPNLQQLLLANNNLTRLVLSRKTLRKLQYVYLGRNAKLKRLPFNLKRARNLEWLQLEYNPSFKQDEFKVFTALTSLNVLINRFNNITGTISSSMSALSRLNSLDISGNRFKDGFLPTTVSALSNLRGIDLKNNPDITYLPPLLGAVTSLSFIGFDPSLPCPKDKTACETKQYSGSTFCNYCPSFCLTCTG